MANKLLKNNRILYIVLSSIAIGYLLSIDSAKANLASVASPVAVRERGEANAAELLASGKQSYEAGKYAEAADLWQKAASICDREGAVLCQAQALNHLSVVYQNLGKWETAKEAIAKSLNLLNTLPTKEQQTSAIFAQALNALGSLQLATGKAAEALETWKQAEVAYTRAKNLTGKLGSQINQAQAFQSLGQYRRSKTLLEQLVLQLQTQPNSLLKAEGLRSLGVALQTIGDLTKSKQILEQSWAIAQQLHPNGDTSATLFAIGNVARDLKQYKVAWEYYQEAEKKATLPILRVQSQLNQLSLLAETEQWELAIALAPQIETNLSSLSPSRATVYAQVNFSESLLKIGEKSRLKSSIANPQKIARLLAISIQQSRQLNDARAEAYSLSQLGKLYAQNQQWENAKNITQQALQISQQIDANDIIARSAWQLGRAFKQQGNTTAAIAAYRNAYQALQSLRRDLVAINSDVQFEFKESVEPIYREFISLLLQPNADRANLKQAREVMEAMQLAELDDFFKDSCLDTKPVEIDAIDRQAAAIYPIILADRLEVILSIPQQPLRHYSTPISSRHLEAKLQELYSALFPGYSNQERLQISQQIYNWIIQPAEADLIEHNIKTLVFVPDGAFRNIPMGVLYDGQHYLIEKYGISLSPGLQLFPAKLESKKLSVLVAALTEARQGFSALPAVGKEIQQIKAEARSEILLNQQFTRNTFHKVIDGDSFSVIHLATHGQFSSNPEETFLLTWNDRIGVRDLDTFFQKSRLGIDKPIELLVMSACQTAAGDNRATLGLAGFALRSGARSTLASLWSVNDESTATLMSEFYRQITQPESKITKAEALRQAQLTVMKNPLYQHPYFWASFVLIGNWL